MAEIGETLVTAWYTHSLIRLKGSVRFKNV